MKIVIEVYHHIYHNPLTKLMYAFGNMWWLLKPCQCGAYSESWLQMNNNKCVDTIFGVESDIIIF